MRLNKLVNFNFAKRISNLILITFLVISVWQDSHAQVINCAPNIVVDCDDNFYEPQMHLEMVQSDFVEGDVIDIVLIADDFNYVSSLQFTITFNPYFLQLVGVPEETIFPVLLNQSVADQGNIAVIWFNGSVSGVCLEPGAIMYRFQFEVMEVKGVDNTIKITNNLAEKEIGLTLDINSPSCSRDFEIEDVIIENSCPDFCVDIDICQADFVSGTTTVDFVICGGAPPYAVSGMGLPEVSGSENENISLTIENIFSETDFDFSIVENDGTTHDTTLTFTPVIGVDVNATITQPACENIRNGSIKVNSISSGISDDLDDFQFEWSGGFFNTTELNNLGNGTYFLTITDPFGCDYVKTYDLFTAGLELFDLDVTTDCNNDEKIAFQYHTLNALDEINQVLVRDQNFVNYPNETSLENRYFNNDLPPGVYTISIFTQNGCSIDTTFMLLGDITRIGGTVWIDENKDGIQNEDFPLEGIPVSIYNCGELDEDPLGTALTNQDGEFVYFVNEGEYQFGIAETEFELQNKLALFTLESEVISVSEEIDGDNNLFFETDIADIAGITDCIIVDCPHYVTGTSEDMSNDLGVLIQSCTDPQATPSFFKPICAEINDDLLTNTICDLSILDGYCGTLRQPVPVTDFTPYCVGNETADNIDWFAFYAPEGDAIIEINPIGCFPGRNGDLGMHAGIFADCELTEMIWCSSEECTPSILSTPLNLLEQGRLYYMFLDGCSGSVCDFEIEITCVTGDCNVPSIESVFDFPEMNVCGPTTITPQMTDDDGNIIDWPDALEFEANTSDQDTNFSFSDTISNACGAVDIFNLEVTVLVDSSSSAPLIACDPSSSSIVFFWLETTNTSGYEVDVMTGPQSGIYDAINLTYTVNGLSPEETVEIQVTAINDTNCGNDGVSSLTCITSPSAVDESLQKQMSIYPNPASDILYLELHNLKFSDVQISIFDFNGRCIEKNVQGNQVNLVDYASGIYFITLTQDDRQAHFRFLKS